MKVEELAERVKSMKASDVLRMAAELIDRGETDIAETLVDHVSTSLVALRLIGPKRKASPPWTGRERRRWDR